MDKQTVVDKLVETCKDLSLDTDTVVLGGGGAMTVMGMRKTTKDLNIWVKKEDFERLVEEHGLFITDRKNRTIRVGEDVFIREHNPYFKPVGYGYDAFKVYCFSLLDMIIQKSNSLQELMRPKEKRDMDYRDIQLLQAALRAKNKVQA